MIPDTHIGLYEGMGGFSLGAHWAGLKTLAWCEWDTTLQVHLKYWFPDADGYGDINQALASKAFEQYANRIGILTAGFPCQPFSSAGKRAGETDPRFLWPQTLEAIRQIRPAVFFGENVAGLVSILEPKGTVEMDSNPLQLFSDPAPVWRHRRVLARIVSDLENEGYLLPRSDDGTPIVFSLPVGGLGAPHSRHRTAIIAYRKGGQQREPSIGQLWAEFGHLSGFAPNAHGYRWGFGQDQHQQAQGGQTPPRASDCSQAGNASHTGSNGGREDHGHRKPAIPDLHSAGEFWQHFPAQSPLYGGDDGLSARLDRGAFPQARIQNLPNWFRRKAIKASGNAVSPQWAYFFIKLIQATL